MKISKIILLGFLFFQILNLSAQEKVDEKTKHYYKDVTFSNNDYQVKLYHIVSKFDYLKFAFKLENKSADNYLIWDNSDSEMIFDWGNKKTSKGKTYKIKPSRARTMTFKVEGETKFLVNSCKFQQKGLSRVPLKGRVQKVEEFKLPARKNTVTAGDFTITLKKSKQKTDETYAKFYVQYNGDKVAVIKPNNISVRVNEDDVFANDVKKDIAYILTKGEEMSFMLKFHIPAKVADMQFAEMFILWNDAFSISEIIPISGIQTTIILDEDLTKEKN